MKRLRLDSIGLTIVLTIVLSMGLGFTLQRLVNLGLAHTSFFAGQNPFYHDMRFYYFVLPARVVSLAGGLDASPADQRLGMIAAAQRRQVRIDILDSPLPGVVNSHARFPTIVRRRIEWLSLIYHPVITSLKTPSISLPKTQVIDPPTREQRPGTTQDTGADDQGMVVEVQLKDGHWLLFTTNVPMPQTDPAAASFSRVSLGGKLALAAVLILLLSLLARACVMRPTSLRH